MIEIVPYEPAYQDGVVSVILPIQREEFGVPITLEAQPDLLDIPGFYQQGSGNFWVALDEREVIGTISLLDIGNGQAALRKMFVKAAYRGKEHGVAQRLMNELVAWSGAHGVREVFLGTTSFFLAAHRFYEKNGFDEIRKDELPPTFHFMPVDSKFYRLGIQSVS
ncbi:GNAT family N-acetyltransferase [Pseudoduganella sp. RAF53_2]|uniref:GNAT family N-acetyltransferase n=1 Tax=unclassified Pseudoduganella TaxID=2637179 RepID=UPI003F9DDC36